MNSRKLRIAIILSILAFMALIGIQYFLVANTYQLKAEQFLQNYQHEIFADYTECMKGGTIYNGAYRIIDTMAGNFKENAKKIRFREDAIQLEKEFLVNFTKSLRKYNNLDDFFHDYQLTHEMPQKFEYTVVIKHIGVALRDSLEAVIYDDKEGIVLLGNLKEYNHNTRIVEARDAIRINKYDENNKLIAEFDPDKSYARINYDFHVDIPERRSILLQQMSGIFALSIITPLITLIAFLYTFQNWLRQKKLSDMKSDFINNVSHELKTPLATIDIANKSLQNNQIISNPELTNNMLLVIDRQSKRLGKLINQVLELSVSETENLPLNRKNTSVNSLLALILHDFKIKSSEKPIQITSNLLAGNDVSALDNFHFTTIIGNLLSNAVKFSKDEPKIEVSTQNDVLNQQIEVRISDEGIGMDDNTQKHLFDKFFRGQKGDLHQVKGLGLGLYYVKKWVEAHQGKVTVKSKKDKGTTFTIVLPLIKN